MAQSKEPSVFAYAQWATLTNKNRSSTGTDVVIKNVQLLWGKFYEGSKDDEIPASSIEGQLIKAGESFTISTCGREDAASGTEGSYDLVDNTTGTKIRHIYWECPWGSKQNTCTASGTNDDWMVQQDGGNYDSGALGDVTFTMVKLS